MSYIWGYNLPVANETLLSNITKHAFGTSDPLSTAEKLLHKAKRKTKLVKCPWKINKKDFFLKKFDLQFMNEQNIKQTKSVESLLFVLAKFPLSFRGYILCYKKS